MDAFVIESLRRLRERERTPEDGRIPLHIEAPRPPEPERDRPAEPREREDRGVAEVSFYL